MSTDRVRLRRLGDPTRGSSEALQRIADPAPEDRCPARPAAGAVEIVYAQYNRALMLARSGPLTARAAARAEARRLLKLVVELRRGTTDQDVGQFASPGPAGDASSGAGAEKRSYLVSA
jgi:hypothetical protein